MSNKKEIKKEKEIQVKVTTEELNILKSEASKLGLGVSSFLRYLGLKNSREDSKNSRY